MKREKKCINCLYYEDCEEKKEKCIYFYNENIESSMKNNEYNDILKENIEIYNEILKEY